MYIYIYIYIALLISRQSDPSSRFTRTLVLFAERLTDAALATIPTPSRLAYLSVCVKI